MTCISFAPARRSPNDMYFTCAGLALQEPKLVLGHVLVPKLRLLLSHFTPRRATPRQPQQRHRSVGPKHFVSTSCLVAALGNGPRSGSASVHARFPFVAFSWTGSGHQGRVHALDRRVSTLVFPFLLSLGFTCQHTSLWMSVNRCPIKRVKLTD